MTMMLCVECKRDFEEELHSNLLTLINHVLDISIKKGVSLAQFREAFQHVWTQDAVCDVAHLSHWEPIPVLGSCWHMEEKRKREERQKIDSQKREKARRFHRSVRRHAMAARG